MVLFYINCILRDIYSIYFSLQFHIESIQDMCIVFAREWHIHIYTHLLFNSYIFSFTNTKFGNDFISTFNIATMHRSNTHKYISTLVVKSILDISFGSVEIEINKIDFKVINKFKKMRPRAIQIQLNNSNENPYHTIWISMFACFSPTTWIELK